METPVHQELRFVLGRALPPLQAMSEEASRAARAPGAWSPREIIGHLIDSACNNHRLFVLAQMQDDLVFPGYDQEAWVDLQRYDDASWAELVELWHAYNRHLARIMEVAPAEVRLRPRAQHSLDQAAWQRLPRDTPATLDYFMRDYVAHLVHHIRQILPGFQ